MFCIGSATWSNPRTRPACCACAREVPATAPALTTVLTNVRRDGVRDTGTYFNAYTSYFRVTSVFKDPSLFGRSLVLGLAVIVVALWLGRIGPGLAFAVSALLWAGLYFSYSQSSMVTLVVVTIAVTLVAGERTARITIAAAAGLALVAASVGVGIYAANHPSSRVTSGRSRLVSVTTRVIADHPLVGVGVGAQPKASHEEAARRGLDSRDASHTTPLTVAAELGGLGILFYLAFLAGAVRVLWDAYVRDRALGLGLAAVFLTLFVHSLVYAGFFEDPVTWGCLAVAAAVVAALPHPLRETDRDSRRARRTRDAGPLAGAENEPPHKLDPADLVARTDPDRVDAGPSTSTIRPDAVPRHGGGSGGEPPARERLQDASSRAHDPDRDESRARERE